MLWGAYPNCSSPCLYNALKNGVGIKSSPNHQPDLTHHPLLFPLMRNTTPILTFFFVSSAETSHSTHANDVFSLHFTCSHKLLCSCSLAFFFFFLLCHQVERFTSCGVRPENTWRTWVKTRDAETQKKAFLTASPPPEPPMEKSGVNGFHLLEAGDGGMTVMLYGALWARCVYAAQWGPDEGYKWGLYDWTPTAVKL